MARPAPKATARLSVRSIAAMPAAERMQLDRPLRSVKVVGPYRAESEGEIVSLVFELRLRVRQNIAFARDPHIQCRQQEDIDGKRRD